jgi:outer membrane protein OmpA-like peptidoglycan-associated protein
MKNKNQRGLLKKSIWLFGVTALLSPRAYGTTAESYDPAWISELGWVGSNGQTGNLYNAPTGASAWVENGHAPWWQTQVAHPIEDYDSSKIPVGTVRLDGALDVEYTLHRPKRSWDVSQSPSGINNVYSFTPGSSSQEPWTGRSGQFAQLNFGFHPITSIMGDIGVELVGNYDERFWFPVNHEHRLHNDDRHIAITRGELKYDNEVFMIRSFEATPNYNWVYKNDLFQLLPTALDVEKYRRLEGSLTPRGGEMLYRTSFGTLNVLGGSEPRFGASTGVYAKYDAPALGSWENSVVYRNEDVPYTLADDDRRWTVSLNSSWKITEQTSSHLGLLYQPFRLDRSYIDPEEVAPGEGVAGSAYGLQEKETRQRDAFGATARIETHPSWLLDQAGAGYTYLGPVAGNKHQVDVDMSRMVDVVNVSFAYMYRQPVVGPVPFIYEGTAANPGALIASPRGPDDPFWVQWDNRKAHVASITTVYDPSPDTFFFKNTPNIIEDWNLNPAESSRWTGALQYRVTHYPTNTDRMFYWDEDRNLIYDPVFHDGARATTYPLSSATGLLRWKQDETEVVADVSGGQALAGNAIAYTPATNFYKPSTTFVQGGLSLRRGPVKVFGRYGQDVWGPEDYHIQNGWTYHRVYQAGISYTFLKDFLAGFRYVGTRMTERFIGSDTGAFNEFRFFLTYHFGIQPTIGRKYTLKGRQATMPRAVPEATLSLSESTFSPVVGSTHAVVIYPKVFSELGLYSWRLFITDSQGQLVKEWQGQGNPPAGLEWNGLDPDGKSVAADDYRVALQVQDRANNQVASVPQTIQVKAPAPAHEKVFTTVTTREGLRVTLSSKVLFDTGRSDLKANAQKALDQVVQLLKAYPDNTLRITGHTDSVGSTTYNQGLSERRASAVANFLEKSGGIARQRIKTVGQGESKPIATNSTEEGRALNRRVEIDILK